MVHWNKKYLCQHIDECVLKAVLNCYFFYYQAMWYEGMCHVGICYLFYFQATQYIADQDYGILEFCVFWQIGTSILEEPKMLIPVCHTTWSSRRS